MKKNIENKIINSLSDPGDMNSARVLDAARTAMAERQDVAKKKNKSVLIYAIATCCIVVICLAIVLPLTLINKNSGYIDTTYPLMSDYLSAHEINIKTYDSFGATDAPAISAPPSAEHPDNIYVPSDCKIISYNGSDVCIEEKYTLLADDQIIMSILLSNDDRDHFENQLFNEFGDLTCEKTISKTHIAYRYDETEHIGYAKFTLNDYLIFMKIKTDSQTMMLNHIMFFLFLQ